MGYRAFLRLLIKAFTFYETVT